MLPTIIFLSLFHGKIIEIVSPVDRFAIRAVPVGVTG
jgi:hypothetical protein